MRTVKGDETSFATDRWGEAESRVRDELLRRRDLLPGEYFELTRCRRFNAGDVVRKQTVELIHAIAREHKVRMAARAKDSKQKKQEESCQKNC